MHFESYYFDNLPNHVHADNLMTIHRLIYHLNDPNPFPFLTTVRAKGEMRKKVDLKISIKKKAAANRDNYQWY